MHHLTGGISSFLHSVNLILITSPHPARIASSQSLSPLLTSRPITDSAFHC